MNARVIPHPAPDHFTADERDWSELNSDERIAQLTSLSHEKLVSVAMDFAYDAAKWERKARRIAALGKHAFGDALKAVRECAA